MAPALTKIRNDGHGIHLSSPPASVRMDTDRGTVCSTDLESRLTPTDDGDLQKILLNLSIIPSLDFCLPLNPLDVPANPVPSPCLQVSPSQEETVLFPSPAQLLSILSSSKGQRDSQQVDSVCPGVPDMLYIPVPDYNSQEASVLQGCSAVPDGGDASHSCSHEEIKRQGYTPLFTLQPSFRQTEEGICCPPPSEQPCMVNLSPNQPAFRAVLGEAVREKLCRQVELCSQAQRLQARLQALLGEHAVQHCNQQLEGLKRSCQPGSLSLESVNSAHPGILPPQVDFEPLSSWQESFTTSSPFAELREFSLCSQAVLRSLQEALDSEATASSSSDEEEEVKERRHRKTRISYVSSSSEGQWLEERAQLGSRWSWLQLRLTELEARIQQMVDLYNHIRSSKGSVVLAESQPMTDRQIQRTLLREMAGLSCTATDADNGPCSPTRLQCFDSVQLSQIVNGLMPPLSFSPLSKQPHSWRGKGSFVSGRGGDVFLLGRRRRLGTRKLFKGDSLCARTRPLVIYHKPRLFSFSSYSPSSQKDSGVSTATISSLSSSSCSLCSSCDPVGLCSDPECSLSRAQLSRTSSSTPSSVLSSSLHIPLSDPASGTQAREEWFLKPLVIDAQALSPAHCKRRSSTPLHISQKNKRHERHKSRVMNLSPIRMAGSAAHQHTKANQRKRRKRRRTQRLFEAEEDILYQLYDPKDSSDDIQEESYTQVSHKQNSQGCVHRRQGESVYNIDNIVIPLSLAKVEKLPYKDILTPSWRLVDISPLKIKEEKQDEENEKAEDLCDEVFLQRHMSLEQKEKMRWSAWGKRKCCRRPSSWKKTCMKRCSHRLSSSGGGMCTSGEESSVEMSCAQQDTDEQQSPADWRQPQTPWEQRVFPLGDDEEETLTYDHLEKAPLGLSGHDSMSSTSRNSISQLSPARSCGAALPSSGKKKNSTHTGC